MSDFDKVFTEKESQILLNKCQLNYDPGHFSFKPRLFFTGFVKELQAGYMGYSTENTLLSILRKHGMCSVLPTFSPAFNHILEELYNEDCCGNTRAPLIHRNNYYIDVENLISIIIGKTANLTDVLYYKNTRLYEAIVSFMIASTHYDSLVPYLKWLCSTDYNKPYSEVSELRPLQEALINKNSIHELNIFTIEDIISTTVVPTYAFISNDFKQFNLEDVKHMMREVLIFSIEIFNRIQSIKDTELKNILLELIVCVAENDIVKQLYLIDDNNIVINKNIQDIIDISDMEKRYYAIRDFVYQPHMEKVVEDCANSYLDTGIGISRMLETYIKFCQNESIMSIRVKTVVMLYTYIVEQGWKNELKGIDDDDDCIPIPGMPAEPESNKSELMDLVDNKYDNTSSLDFEQPNTSEITENISFEELDRLSSSFENNGYEFDVQTTIDTDDTSKTKYLRISENMSLLNTNLIRSIKEIKVYNTGGKNPGKKVGKLDRKNIYKYKYDKNIFCDNTYKTKESDLAFGIILDVSGSMWGEGIKYGKSTMVVLHETLKALNINHSIITHTSEGFHQCTIEKYQAFKEEKTYNCNKNYALANIREHNGNCDSAALYYMEQSMRRVHNKDKICIIFSDGRPTECTDTELKDQVRHMERNGIKVIGIGIDFPNIKEYYKNYANGKNLKEMFDIVSNILKEYVLEKVDKE